MADPEFAVRGLVFLCGWGRLPVTHLFDVYGDPTDDPELAFTAVAMLPDGRWLASKCLPHELRREAL
jgi:hypothetical protein